MTNQTEPTIEQFSSEGMPTIPLRPMHVSTNINRVYGICIAVIVFFYAISASVLMHIVTDMILPQLVIVLGICVLSFVFAIVRRMYWLCVLAVAVGAVCGSLPWVATYGGVIIGLSVGVTFLLIYGVARVWFERSETWPFVVSAIATGYALLALAARQQLIPDAIVLPIVLIVVSGLFVLQLRRQNVL